MSRREGSLEDPQTDSSVSSLTHLEAKIRQTHSLAGLLTKYAEQLLQEYVSGDGGGSARGLENREVQITGILDHPFSQPHFPAAEIGALERDHATATATATATADVFPAKVLGLRVCGLYREWVSRTEADLGQLGPGGPA
ncbi:PREDICTED: cardiotrophin-1 [Ceratotherium simum simum]|uniref:Cardiotrophin-1 n=1 Tax=Ceratotherium simum simum TaxID=73337 RepID=A0ABM1DDW5_CERSS|nr:PREDICTED: cardiotrophin-1 [Ceratotherium simum simum]